MKAPQLSVDPKFVSSYNLGSDVSVDFPHHDLDPSQPPLLIEFFLRRRIPLLGGTGVSKQKLVGLFCFAWVREERGIWYPLIAPFFLGK